MREAQAWAGRQGGSGLCTAAGGLQPTQPCRLARAYTPRPCPAPTVLHNGCERLLQRRLHPLAPARAQGRGRRRVAALLWLWRLRLRRHADVNQPLLPVQPLLGGAALIGRGKVR